MQCVQRATLLSLAHFFMMRMMYSTCGFPVLLNIGKTSFSVSLKTNKANKERKYKHRKHDQSSKLILLRFNDDLTEFS